MSEIKLSDFSRFRNSIRNLIETDPCLLNALNDKKIYNVNISFTESEHGNNITHKLHISFDQYCFVDSSLPDSGYYTLQEMITIAEKLIEKK